MKLKQIFCSHECMTVRVRKDYMSIGDEYNKIPSANIELTCYRCDKVMHIWDKWYNSLKYKEE